MNDRDNAVDWPYTNIQGRWLPMSRLNMRNIFKQITPLWYLAHNE